MLLALALDGMNHTDDAFKQIKEAAWIVREEPSVHFALEHLYLASHDFEHAAPQFEQELKQNPDNVQACAYIGDMKMRMNDEAAETFPTKAVHLQKDMRMAYNGLGKIYSEQNKNDEALTVPRTAERVDPTEPDAHYHLARVYAALGQKQQANAEYAKTKQLHEKSAESLIQNISGDKREVVP